MFIGYLVVMAFAFMLPERLVTISLGEAELVKSTQDESNSLLRFRKTFTLNDP
jgi:hypothetical protein